MSARLDGVGCVFRLLSFNLLQTLSFQIYKIVSKNHTLYTVNLSKNYLFKAVLLYMFVYQYFNPFLFVTI